MDRRQQAILLPGAVLPADLAYGGLIEALGDEVGTVAKDLELYADEMPPPDYSLAAEVQGILRCAEEHGFDRFHLVGYSAGGAASLVFAVAHPERVASLALLEPGWTGNEGLGPAEQAVQREFGRVMGLPADEVMPAFVRMQLAPGVEPPPPPGSPPPWMAKRPAGLAALNRAFPSESLPPDALQRFRRPVYYALGRLSNQDQYGRSAERLSRLFPDFTLEVFEERHHFDPPHRVEPERLAGSLHDLWQRADAD